MLIGFVSINPIEMINYPPQIATLSESSCSASSRQCLFAITNHFAKTVLTELKVFNTTSDSVIAESKSPIMILSEKTTNVTTQIPLSMETGELVGYSLNFSDGHTLSEIAEIQ